MKHTPSAAFLAASTALANPPRGFIARPRAEATDDPKAMIANLQRAFAEFKAAHDEKLSGKADVVVAEKVERIDAAVGNFQAAIDEMNAKLATAAIGGAGTVGDLPASDPEYVKAFKAHMRKGDVQAAITKGTDADGGYLAPIEWDRSITGKLKEVSPIRAHARVVTITTAGFKRNYTDRAVGSGWVGEVATRAATSTPQFGQLDFVPGEIYANPAISQGALDDAAIDIEQWLGDEVDTEFARQEGIAFISGNGVNKPFGMLTYVTGAANAAKHPWGAIEVVNSGAAAAITTDGLIDLIYSLPASYRANAKFFMNRLSQGSVRKLKDGQGNYIWQPSFQGGAPATILGEPLVEVPDMPAVAANAISALYGDMGRGYLIVDRLGIRVLRDPFTNKPFVHFYTTKRVGGGVDNPEAMRALKIAA
ncbi:phage major capsid protein [Methylopila sp. 73B]|uniref:phage major capsid protein n=1 Tax=Methylopila sp. 73B TaxID=1120792 RepID=UPI00036E57EB|nr:phage major capsid protein [Methylopila sp. 73B]